ncbi:EF-hand domain-containing protein 1-like [Centropristis striata]|uniref:EF-hand domain-containing protein 1-like n=1 Tax=Centropristis striata TaxID=184440 RepID=UPI0027DEB842|nr:EF-hand domain-containing protein 1-like [Centropristis striata]
MIIKEMSWNNGLPFLPGYSFPDVTKSAFHRSQTLVYKDGYAVARRPTAGIGQDPLLSEQLIQQEINELSFDTPDLIYGSSEQGVVEEFIPAYVAFDKKVLCFRAYFQEKILFSTEDECRVRPVVIFYYLEDDSMCIIEPAWENSGLHQGTRLKRHRLPKNEHGEHYQWKDLNIGMDLTVYGVTYRITQCDAFTKEFLESEGIVLNNSEQMPVDPYIKRRQNPQPSFTTDSTASKFIDSSHQFLMMDGKVLCFLALWYDADGLIGQTRPVSIHYYLGNDTVEIRLVPEPRKGMDPSYILMRLKKPPKKLKAGSFPSCVLEVSAAEVDEYFSPKDFQTGRMVTLLGRRFLLYDCDGFTKEYYEENYPDMEQKPTEIPKKTELSQERKKEVPPYNGYGSLEDSLQNCLSLIPNRPNKDVRKMLENAGKVLNYSARLDSQYPEDEGRRFLLSYFLSDDTIRIFEKRANNSGFIGGKFLEKTRIPKPSSTADSPQFYSPADFAIGATVEVFSHRFVLTDADHNALTYLKSNASQMDSMHQKLGVGTAHNEPADQNGKNQFKSQL